MLLKLYCLYVKKLLLAGAQRSMEVTGSTVFGPGIPREGWLVSAVCHHLAFVIMYRKKIADYNKV